MLSSAPLNYHSDLLIVTSQTALKPAQLLVKVVVGVCKAAVVATVVVAAGMVVIENATEYVTASNMCSVLVLTDLTVRWSRSHS